MKPTRALSSLSLRIYLVSVLQLAVAALSVILVHRLFEERRIQREAAQAPDLVLGFGEMFEDADKLQRAMDHVSGGGVLQLTYYRLDGQRVASTEESLPPLPAAELALLREAAVTQSPDDGHGATTAAAIMRGGEMVGYGRLRMRHAPHGGDRGDRPDRGDGPDRGDSDHGSRGHGHHDQGPGDHGRWSLIGSIREPAGIAMALLASAIIALLFARSLARPLKRLAHAAEAFGAGDLSARANLRRSDEIGSVARTFDEMADRVNALLRTQREFLANVSHELRTPLARIRVALDIASEGDVAAARESLSDITEDWADLDRLVDSLIMIARMDLTGDPTMPAAALRHAPLDAVELAERAAAAVRAAYPRHSVDVEHADAALPLVADAGLLRRVLDNVLTNAAKYADPGAPIQLAVRRVGDEIEFAVADRGIGIDAPDLPHLFEPFFRADRSRTRKTGGTGLGLALAKRIIDAHQGRIRVDSAVGTGTTVTFAVPVAPSIQA
jgi:signal transduction histidine kinase